MLRSQNELNNSERVCLSHSIHISCRLHRWILVCLVHIQSLWLARLRAKKMPLFPLLLLLVVVTQGPFLPKIDHGCFCIFLLLYSVFRVSGKLLVWGVVVIVVPVWWTNVGFSFWCRNPMLRFGVLPSVDVACEECCRCMQRCWFPQTLPTRQSSRCMSTVLTPD